MSVRATRAVYRLLLRQARALDQEGVQQLDIRMPVDKGALVAWQAVVGGGGAGGVGSQGCMGSCNT